MDTNEMDNDLEQMPVLRMDYRKINEQCYMCSEPSKVIRITQTMDGELYVSTMCLDHAKGEQNHVAEAGDLVNVPGTGTFVNQAMFEKLQSLDGMDAIRAVIEGDEEDSED